ncbi:16S rRNA (cytosine(1402)-N(4))-methyltransferase RsmH [Desulfuromonas carbonis]|uniref:16S rRNA (cytosine(1402)-N(4))-methyltransferase RsmH n=1 Tax=Desulfuromonas sp. DDH964 TaxID=1823759 RepID=UPI00078C9E90|nr:16S rRNA (cytosine(1402)-N(4))-methyltransferase RsmH [Desulfuromonas sp. DDH964]AMV73118.1 16S rRNA m(4)C1402 methyltransferase [Desulfuromonas sp. DDH964]
MGGDFQHLSVMPGAVLDLLQPRPGGVYLDGTVGGGGHARLLLEASGPDGRLIGLDRDPAALAKAAATLQPYAGRFELEHANFADAGAILSAKGIAGVDGILLDLGVSSHQLDAGERGFSFRQDAPLDMRMDPTRGATAAELLAEASAEELQQIFREFGEERFAGRIARKIVARRQEAPLLRTLELAELVRDVVPGGRVPARIHPATRVFQALRIAVNGELDHVARGVAAAIGLLNLGGRLAVISFHSLEDRIVKRLFVEEAKGCICPPRLPICQCGHTPRVELLTRRGLRADETEVETNPRARSAVLRGVRRIN